MNRLLIAAGVVVVLAVAVVLVFPRETETTTEAHERPSPLTKIDTDEVTKVVLRHQVGKEGAKREQTVELVRGAAEGEGEPVWRLGAPVEYEANQGAVKTLLTRLGELELRDVASEQASSHEALEVDDENGISVQVYAGDNRLANFVIGRYRSGNTMVRVADSDIVWRATGSLRYVFGKETSDWREKKIFDFEREAITRVEFHDGHGSFVFEMRTEPAEGADAGEGEANWAVVEVDAEPPAAAEEPPDDEASKAPAKAGAKAPAKAPERLTSIEDFDPAKVRSLVTSIAQLRCTDFADQLEGVETGLGDDAARVVFRTGSGDSAETHTLLIGGAADDRSVYVRREDRDQVFTLSKALADRLRPDAHSFQKRAPVATKAGPPSGLTGDLGEGSIPPDVLQAAKAEIQRQQLLKQLTSKAGR